MNGTSHVTDPAAQSLKILAYCLDPAAGEAEAVTAATMFARTARKNGVTYSALTLAVARTLPPPTPAPQPKAPARPAAWWNEMPCGRYRGQRLSDIHGQDPSYVQWVANQFEGNDDLRADAAVVIQFARARKAGVD